MARSIRYVGKTPDNIGRFGIVQPNDILTLDENEWRSVKMDPRFEAADDQGDRDLPPDVTPIDNEDYRLTSLPWGTRFIHRCIHRLGRNQLVKVAKAMNAQGIPTFNSSDMDRKEMADAILEAAGKMRWL